MSFVGAVDVVRVSLILTANREHVQSSTFSTPVDWKLHVSFDNLPTD